jgi:hypothetical protein
MADARGEKTVRSTPRWSMSCSWLDSTDSRISSSLITGYGWGVTPASHARTCSSRHAVCAAGAVV